MTDERTRETVLKACMARAKEVKGLVAYADDSIVSKTIVDKPAGTITLFAFDSGQKLSEHTSPYDAVVQVIDGQASLTIGAEKVVVSGGEVIVMPGNVPHSVAAEGRFKMLLTMIRA